MERGGGWQQCGHMLYVKCAGCRWELRKSGDGCTILGVSAREKKASTMTHLKRFACRLQGHRSRECARTLYISCKDRMGSVMVPGRRLWPSAISDGDERGGVSKRMRDSEPSAFIFFWQSIQRVCPPYHLTTGSSLAVGTLYKTTGKVNRIAVQKLLGS